MNKVIRMLIMMISFSIVLNAEMRLSERYGEYYDKGGRKLTIDKHGYGVFEDKHGKSRVFKIGEAYSKETNYSFKMYRTSVTDISLIFTDKYSCIFMISSSIRYSLKKSSFLRDRKENDYIKYHLK